MDCFSIPESRDEDSGPGADVVGAVLSAVGIGSLVFGLIEGRGYGWWTADTDVSLLGTTWAQGGPSPVPIALTVAVVALAGWAWSRPADAPPDASC